MKKKQKSFIIPWHIFPFDVAVFLGTERKDVLSAIGKRYNLSDEEKDLLVMKGTGRFVILYGGQSVLWLKDYPDKGSGILAHEIFHAVYYLLDRIGIKITDDSDELVAYMIQYLTNEINKKL